MTDVRFKVQNLDFVTGWRKDNQNLDHLAAKPADRPVVILYQEGKNLLGKHTVSDLLGKAFRGLTGKTPATAGSGIYSRGIRVRSLHLWLLGKFPQTLARWAVQGHVKMNKTIRVLAVHVPPKRSGRKAQNRALRKILNHVRRAQKRGQGFIVGGDFNMPLHVVARYLRQHGIHCKAYGQDDGNGIVGFIVSANLEVSKHGQDAYGLKRGDTDHPSEWIDVTGCR